MLNSLQIVREFFNSHLQRPEGLMDDKRRIKMTKQRKTSARVASQSSKVMLGKGTRKDAKASAASALSQRAPKRKSSR